MPGGPVAAFSNRTRYRSDAPFARQRDNGDCCALHRQPGRMSWECRFGFRPRDLHHSSTSCGPGSRFQSHQTRSFQPLGSAAFGCLAFRLDLAWLPPVSRRALPRRVQIALKPAAKVLGMHWIFVRGKGRKHVIADSALKRIQVDARSRRLNADQHHLGFALRTGGALKRSRRNGGRQGLGLGHGASLHKRREHNTLGHRYCPGRGPAMEQSIRRRELSREFDSGPLAPIALQEEYTAAGDTPPKA